MRLLVSLLLVLILACPSWAAQSGIYQGNVTGTVLDVGPTDAKSPCIVYAIQFLNTTAAVAYLQVFNTKAASVTIGTTAPIATFGVPASGQVTVLFPTDGWFVGGTGLSVAGTTARAGATGAAQDVNIVFSCLGH